MQQREHICIMRCLLLNNNLVDSSNTPPSSTTSSQIETAQVSVAAVSDFDCYR